MRLHSKKQRLDPAIQRLIDRADPRDRDTVNAARSLRNSGRGGAPLILSGQLGTWLEHWKSGMRPAITSTHRAEHYDNNLIARAAFRLTGHLHDPEIQLDVGLRAAAGEQLVVTSDHGTSTNERLPAGILLHVTDIQPAGGHCTVEVPVLGERRLIPAGGALARRVTYDYATTDNIERTRHRPGAARQPARGLTW